MAKWKRDVIYGIAILVACVAGVLATMNVKITGTMYWTPGLMSMSGSGWRSWQSWRWP